MKIKRIIALIMVLVCAISAAACSSAPQPNQADTDAVMAAVDKFASCSSFNIEQLTKSTETLENEGEKISYEGTITKKFSLMYEPDFKMMSDNTVVVKSGEGIMEQNGTSFILREGDVYTNYFTDGTAWQKYSTADTSFLIGYSARNFVSAFYVEYLSFAKAGEDTLDSGKALRYEGALAGQELVTMLESMGYFNNGISSMSENLQVKIKENLAKDLKPVTVKVWVDEASGYPVRFEVSMTGMLKDLSESINKTLGNTESEEWAITDYVITMNISDFNGVGDMVLPAEAADAKEYTGQ